MSGRPTKIRVVDRAPTSSSTSVNFQPVQNRPTIPMGRTILQPMIARAPTTVERVRPPPPLLQSIQRVQAPVQPVQPVAPLLQPVQQIRQPPTLLPMRRQRQEVIEISDDEDEVMYEATDIFEDEDHQAVMVQRTRQVERIEPARQNVEPPREEFDPEETKFIVFSLRPTFLSGNEGVNKINMMIECGEQCSRQIIRDNFNKFMTQAFYKALKNRQTFKNSRSWIMTQENDPKSLNANFFNQQFCTSRECAQVALRQLQEPGDMMFKLDIPARMMLVWSPRYKDWVNVEDNLPSSKFTQRLMFDRRNLLTNAQAAQPTVDTKPIITTNEPEAFKRAQAISDRWWRKNQPDPDLDKIVFE